MSWSVNDARECWQEGRQRVSYLNNTVKTVLLTYHMYHNYIPNKIAFNMQSQKNLIRRPEDYCKIQLHHLLHDGRHSQLYKVISILVSGYSYFHGPFSVEKLLMLSYQFLTLVELMKQYHINPWQDTNATTSFLAPQ